MALLPYSYGVGILPPPYPFLQYYDCYDDCGCCSSSSDDDCDSCLNESLGSPRSIQSSKSSPSSKKITITNSTVVLVNGKVDDVSDIIQESLKSKRQESFIDKKDISISKPSNPSSSSSSDTSSEDENGDENGEDKLKKKKKYRLNIFNH